jgi:hypothetical protein
MKNCWSARGRTIRNDCYGSVKAVAAAKYLPAEFEINFCGNGRERRYIQAKQVKEGLHG